jgi:hypothetical protein
MSNYKRLKSEALAWLDYPELNTFVTVTLKQRLWSVNAKDQCYLHPISLLDVQKVGCKIRDRVSRRIFGNRTFKYNTAPPFLVFGEVSAYGRHHLHILASKPDYMDFDTYTLEFRYIARRIEWVHKHIDIRPIVLGQHNITEEYSLKTGWDAFLPQSSYIPQ